MGKEACSREWDLGLVWSQPRGNCSVTLYAIAGTTALCRPYLLELKVKTAATPAVFQHLHQMRCWGEWTTYLCRSPFLTFVELVYHRIWNSLPKSVMKWICWQCVGGWDFSVWERILMINVTMVNCILLSLFSSWCAVPSFNTAHWRGHLACL